MAKRYFIFLGSKDDKQFLEADEVVGWTSHDRARKDDEIFFYICAPHSAIVAHGIKVYEDDWTHPPDTDKRFSGRAMTDIVVRRADLNIPMRKLRELFPEWAWLRYPRQNTQIPEDLVKPFLELMEVTGG